MQPRRALITCAGGEPAHAAAANPGGPRRRDQDRAARSSSRKSSPPASRKSASSSARATRRPIAAAAGGPDDRLRFVEQTAPLGYGHAVFCAREFAGASRSCCWSAIIFYVSGGRKRARSNWSKSPRAENCAVSAVQATHESKLPYYGAVGGRLVAAGARPVSRSPRCSRSRRPPKPSRS